MRNSNTLLKLESKCFSNRNRHLISSVREKNGAVRSLDQAVYCDVWSVMSASHLTRKVLWQSF